MYVHKKLLGLQSCYQYIAHYRISIKMIPLKKSADEENNERRATQN